MKLTFNIRVYHGTNYKNVNSIIKNGFSLDTISCATQDKNIASGYGNTLIYFKYPFTIYLSFINILEDIEYIYRFISDYKNNSLITGVAGFKPKKVSIEPVFIY